MLLGDCRDLIVVSGTVYRGGGLLTHNASGYAVCPAVCGSCMDSTVYGHTAPHPATTSHPVSIIRTTVLSLFKCFEIK